MWQSSPRINKNMEVELNPGLNVNTGPSQPATRQNSIQPSDNNIQTSDTTMSIGRTQALEQTLQDTPQIRPEMVARANALVADDNYPSDETLNQMAGLLANHLSNLDS
jgi:hypothetical protein